MIASRNGLPTRRPALTLFAAGTAVGAAAGGVVVVLGAVESARAAVGAALGVAVALVALSVGPALLAVTRTVSPPAVMAIALTGYAVTVLLLAVVYALLGAASSLSGDHVGYGMAVAAAAALAGQGRAVMRLRALAFGNCTEGDLRRSDVSPSDSPASPSGFSH